MLKVINNCSYLAVNALIEYVNYRFYTAHEKEAIATKFSPANLFWKISRMTVQHEKSAKWLKCNMKRLQHKKAAWKYCKTEKEQL